MLCSIRCAGMGDTMRERFPKPVLGWFNALLHALFAVLLLASTAAQALTENVPGPSAALFKHPYYKCTTNYYVATNGNDSNDGTTPNTPWLTLQHANDS